MEAYNPEHWHEFFTMTGGAAAVLAGLVFVAMSLNVKAVTRDVTHRYRALGTLTGFVSGFMMCAFGLLGEQTNVSLGIVWLIITFATTAVYINGFVQATKNGGSSVGLRLERIVSGSSLFILQIIGSLLMIVGNPAGIYIATSALILGLAYMISGAWLLFVGISEVSKPSK